MISDLMSSDLGGKSSFYVHYSTQASVVLLKVFKYLFSLSKIPKGYSFLYI